MYRSGEWVNHIALLCALIIYSDVFISCMPNLTSSNIQKKILVLNVIFQSLLDQSTSITILVYSLREELILGHTVRANFEYSKDMSFCLKDGQKTSYQV